MFSQSSSSFPHACQRAAIRKGDVFISHLLRSSNAVSSLVCISIPVLDVEAKGRGKASGSRIDPLDGPTRESEVTLSGSGHRHGSQQAAH